MMDSRAMSGVDHGHPHGFVAALDGVDGLHRVGERESMGDELIDGEGAGLEQAQDFARVVASAGAGTDKPPQVHHEGDRRQR